jgi:photosystem II stability/assembly factor-like uncharacterized protein
MKPLLYPVFALFLALFFALPAAAQKKTRPTDQPAHNDTLLSALKWRNIGPFRGGRSNAVSGVVGNDNVYYCGYTGGGLWKTDDAGSNWRCISDGFFRTSSVGDVAVAESDPNVVYAGMGEHAVRGVMSSYGDGVYRSTDAGQTWRHLGLDKTRHISDVVVHPQNPDVVYVAAQGPIYGPGEDRGVYKSTDGGVTWRKVLYVDPTTGVSSLSMDMQNPRILYAATWQHRRYPWKVESGGPGSGVWKSTDAGETWQKINDGLPELMGKIGLSVSRAQPNRIYAIVEAEKAKAGVYRSDDGGKKWTLMTTDQALTARSWYYMEIAADPQQADWVYVLNAPFMFSSDGGRTFRSVAVRHGDTHDLWINPHDSGNMILGDDGGAEITFNTCRTWSSQDNQPTAQFYRVNVDNLFPYRVYGGQQDNSSVVIPSRSSGSGISANDWFEGPGCECAFVAFDPNKPEQLYGGCYQGQIEVMDAASRLTKDIMPYPAINLGNAPRTMKYRYNWNAPIVASPHDPRTIYHAAQVLLKTTDGGLSWTAISPDLTRNDTTKQGLGGGPITNEGAGGETYNTINYVVESPHERGVIYTGADDGSVFVTRDGGKTWKNVTPPGLPESVVHSIEVSPHDKGTAWVCANRFKFNEFNSWLYKTTDYGVTWTRQAEALKDDFLRVVREDKKVPGLLYGGAERGFYLSRDGGATWQRWQSNLPVVPVTDLVHHQNDLVAATAGRSYWILDDVGALQQGAGTFEKPARLTLYTPKPGVLFSAPATPETNMSLGRNPLNGVVLDYFLAAKPDSNQLFLKILDHRGQVIRTYTNRKDPAFKTYPGGPPAPQLLPAERGLNRFAWDLRTERLPEVADVYVYGDYRGHRVAPGDYRARLILRGDSMEVPIVLQADPRLRGVTPADWQAQQQLVGELESTVRDIHGSINTLRRVRKQVEAYNELLKDQTDKAALVKAGKTLIDRVNQWESSVLETRMKNFQDILNFPAKLNSEFLDLRSRLDATDPRVTGGARERVKDLQAEWAKAKAGYEAIVGKEIGEYEKLFRESGVPVVIR